MLILVAVTISMAVNGGLFEQAGRAVGEYKNAFEEEEQLGSGKIKVGDKWYASIDDYLNNNPITIGIVVTPKEITLKKNEEGAEGEEILTATITASTFGMENEPEITWEKTSDAIAISPTEGKSVTVSAEGTENAEVTVTAKCTYEGQVYTATSKITLEMIEKEEPKITASTMQSDLHSYLGKKIDYKVEYDDKSSYGNKEWEIFYADGKHIYIITKGHLAEGALVINGYTGTSEFTADNLETKYPAVAAGLLNKTYDPTSVGSELKYTSTYSNMKATQYLLDSTVDLWKNLANNEYAEWAIGAPTFELFVNSYNAKYPSRAVTLETPTGTGYGSILSTTNSVPVGTHLCHSVYNYWLACPSTQGGAEVRYVRGDNGKVIRDTYTSKKLFRPVVCLDADVQLIWDETNSVYTISKVQ